MKVGKWKLLLPLALLAVGATIGTSGALATPAQSSEVRFAIMTDCKGAFAFGYEVDTAGTIAALSQYAGAKPKNKKKPSAGMTGVDGRRQEAEPRGYRLRRRDSRTGPQGDTPAHDAAPSRHHDRAAVR